MLIENLELNNCKNKTPSPYPPKGERVTIAFRSSFKGNLEGIKQQTYKSTKEKNYVWNCMYP